MFRFRWVGGFGGEFGGDLEENFWIWGPEIICTRINAMIIIKHTIFGIVNVRINGWVSQEGKLFKKNSAKRASCLKKLF